MFLSLHVHVENNIPTGMSVNLLSLLMVILGRLCMLQIVLYISASALSLKYAIDTVAK